MDNNKVQRSAVKKALSVWVHVNSSDDSHELKISKVQGYQLISESPDGWSIAIHKDGSVDFHPRGYTSDKPTYKT